MRNKNKLCPYMKLSVFITLELKFLVLNTYIYIYIYIYRPLTTKQCSRNCSRRVEGAGESPAPENWAHSAKGAHPYRKACRSRGIKVAAPPLALPCDGPVTYPGDIKTLRIPSKGRSVPTLNMTTRLCLTDKELGN